MVVCCVPFCGADSWKCDGSITFYDFPTNPDLAAKWIKQINTAVKVKPMWFPRGKPVICSKHFLHTDFKGDTDSLKPRCIPTVFGHRYIGQNPEAHETDGIEDLKKSSPLIVKVNKPHTYSNLRIVDVRSESNSNDPSNIQIESTPEVIEINEGNLYNPVNVVPTASNVISTPIALSHKNFHPVNTSLASTPVNVVPQNTFLSINNKLYLQTSNPSNQLNSAVKQTVVNSKNVPKQNAKKNSPSVLPKITKKKEKNNDLIEIGPNTFLKINPDVIKVNKKQTPSGNTVLQFLMDQKLAKSYSGDLLPKLVKGKPSSSTPGNNSSDISKVLETAVNEYNNKEAGSSEQQKDTVQHVLGHVVDTHVCDDSQANDDVTQDDDIIMLDSQDDDISGNTSDINSQAQKQNINGIQTNKSSPSKTDTAVINKAPVLLTTNMPLSHCFIDKPKYVLQLKQKSRQIAAMKAKISSLTKKVEELEDRCIVQERQLSYSFIKRLKTIRKNASKGDASATYILEQIRSYSNNAARMRWSDSTLAQCAVWCRKAPYAYEYFKKADFFKLPCLGTVKRFIKKHPELKFTNKTISKNGGTQGENNDDDDESSSDFDFDDSDDQNDHDMSEEENKEPSKGDSSAQAQSSAAHEKSPTKNRKGVAENNEISRATKSISIPATEMNMEISNSSTNNEEKETSNPGETDSIPTTIDTSNLELQEIMLPSGEVVQCYSTSISNGTDIGNQYYIIPNVSEQNNGTDHENIVVQADSLPVILQNIDASQLQIQNQDQQLIFIANSSGLVECTETEVSSA